MNEILSRVSIGINLSEFRFISEFSVERILVSLN